MTSTFMGHPKGLLFLALTELWERFSYYGMTTLLMLYMVNHLLLPGHVENIAGFPTLRSAIESVLGPLSTQALASQIFGLYAGFASISLPSSAASLQTVGSANALPLSLALWP